MQTTIDSAGRIVVPKSLRSAAQLAPGTVVDIRLVDGTIEIEPTAEPVRLERRGRLLVASPRGSRPRLTATAVDAVASSLRGRGAAGSERE